MILPLLLLQTIVPAETAEARFQRCADLAIADRAAGEAEASAWRMAGGGFLAQQCLGLAYATGGNLAAAARIFEEAARAAEVAKDRRSAALWAQAGNGWLAAGDAAKARGAMDAALAGGGLSGLALGEAYLDRGRALVAAGDLAGARADINRALQTAGDDPLAWLLSATLARRSADLARARTDIAQALKRSPDDASVQLEAGNIAALSGDAAGARGGWTKAVELGGTGPVAASARAALAQFKAGE